MSKIKLRPHHVLCISFFEGKGYSEEFVIHMTGIIQALNEDARVDLVNGPDQICEACPNNDNPLGGCVGKASRYDQVINNLCMLESNHPVSWNELQNRLKKEIIKPGRLVEVCGDCEWYHLCFQKTQVEKLM